MQSGIDRFVAEFEMQRVRINRLKDGPKTGIEYRVNIADAYNGFHMLEGRFDFEADINHSFKKEELRQLSKIFAEDDHRWRSLMTSRVVVAHVKSHEQEDGETKILFLYNGDTYPLEFETSAGSFDTPSIAPSSLEIKIIDEAPMHRKNLENAFSFIEKRVAKAIGG